MKIRFAVDQHDCEFSFNWFMGSVCLTVDDERVQLQSSHSVASLIDTLGLPTRRTWDWTVDQHFVRLERRAVLSTLIERYAYAVWVDDKVVASRTGW